MQEQLIPIIKLKTKSTYIKISKKIKIKKIEQIKQMIINSKRYKISSKLENDKNSK
jgi:hypothetical protein